ncbi:hypothetical protein PENFLA_c012G00059 [Penicillium flavigenum]|uniref:Mid2 domain-containing protein n=1 Tax=Penicillium flavigenum TaxID=254877 RepID=A0A1V6T958_9EURO|nr:hypothetical protein PENFLA_c012G00059 [Penicillium flavigenum]
MARTVTFPMEASFPMTNTLHAKTALYSACAVGRGVWYQIRVSLAACAITSVIINTAQDAIMTLVHFGGRPVQIRPGRARTVCRMCARIRLANYSVPITQCSRDSKWCCGAIDSQECCDTDMRFELATQLGQSPSSSPTTATISGTSTSSNQTPAETSTDKLSSSTGDGGVHQGLGQGAKIGLGVGIGLGVPVVCGIAAAMFLRWRRKRSPPVVGLHRGEGNFAKPEIGGTSVAELDNRALARELEGTVVMAEMGTTEPKNRGS